jgi:hypothetical protein
MTCDFAWDTFWILYSMFGKIRWPIIHCLSISNQFANARQGLQWALEVSAASHEPQIHEFIQRPSCRYAIMRGNMIPNGLWHCKVLNVSLAEIERQDSCRERWWVIFGTSHHRRDLPSFVELPDSAKCLLILRYSFPIHIMDEIWVFLWVYALLDETSTHMQLTR